ncbi:MAG: hypothetical protein JWQ18_1347 [Conexibacter sp.]|nr:hypothetical protein [Conexibacter sp.]
MAAPELAALKSAETSLKAAVTELRKAAGAVVPDAPVLTGTKHIGKRYLATKADPPDGEAARRRDDIALLQDEVADLCGRVAALVAQIG